MKIIVIQGWFRKPYILNMKDVLWREAPSEDEPWAVLAMPRSFYDWWRERERPAQEAGK